MKTKLITACLIMAAITTSAQDKTNWEQKLPKVALKTNVLYLATSTLNASIEFPLGKKTTMEIAGNYNPWEFTNSSKHINHLLIQPEFRYWLCERYNGHFFGVHAIAGHGNAGGIKLPLELFPALENKGYEGYYAGGGLSYGYQFFIAPRLNLEATIGAGALYFTYKTYENKPCGLFDQEENIESTYFGPTKAGLTLTYFLKYKNR